MVESSVDGEVGKKLQTINIDPHLKQNHHQWLKEFGRQKVHDQIERLVTIMKLCDGVEDFQKKVCTVFKNPPPLRIICFAWDQP